MQHTWGGARPGAGRKKGSERATFCCRLKVENKEYLQQQAKEQGITATEFLEMIVETFKEIHK